MTPKRKILLLVSAYDPEIHLAAVAAARKYNWHLDANMLMPLTNAKEWRGDGILCSLTDTDNHSDFIAKRDVPCVDISTWRNDIKMPRVSADNEAIGRIAAQHFISNKHRHFAWFSSTKTPFGSVRCESYHAELNKHGFNAICIDGKNTKEIAKQIKKLPRPCAVFTQQDTDAAWISSVCIENGFHIPFDFAILGVDNNPLVCEVQSVPLSSIDRDTRGIVLEGARMLQQAIDGSKLSNDTKFISPKGVVARSSSDEMMIGDDLIREVLRYLKSHLSEKVGTPEVISEFGISRSLLNLRFQKSMQTSLHKWLMQSRLNKAAELLTYTDWSIEEISARTGFTHSSHLSNTFKTHYKISPLAYRKANSTLDPEKS